MRKLTFTLIFFLVFYISKAQSVNPDDYTGQIELMPPSIENYNFTKYGNLGLNNNNGSFSHSIPVYNIKYGPLSLPISLNYSTSGVKVNDIAGLVGMGWNLNAGGMITRVIKGEPDENFNTEELRISSAEMINTIDGGYSDSEYNNQGHRDRIINIWRTIWPDATIKVNTEQDWFNFNFNNISGSFYLDNGNIYIESDYSDIKGEVIETTHLGSKVLEFKFTLPTGVIYTFGGGLGYSESSEIETNCQRNFEVSYPTTWYLKNINFRTWDINFIYSQNTTKRYPLSFFEEYTLTATQNNLPDLTPSSQECISTFKSIDAKYLEAIEFGDSRIEFDYLNQRSDYYAGKILDAITVKHNASIIKSVDVDYIYSTSSGNSSVVQSSNQDLDIVKKRPFLNKVTVDGEKEYLFNYNNINGLPPRLSYKQDIFGYSNSNIYSSLVNLDNPYYQGVHSNYFVNRFKSKFNGIDNANRFVDPVKSLYGVLTKITYPTGGFSEIVYENNTTYKTVSNLDSNEHFKKVELYNCTTATFPDEDILVFESNGSPISITAKATLDACNYNHHRDKHILSVKNITTGTVVLYKELDPSLDFNVDGSELSNNINNFSPIQTNNGDEYEIKYSVESLVNDIYGEIYAEYNLEETHDFVEKNYSGARVKEIYDRSFSGNTPINIKTFKYKSKDSLNALSTSLRHKYTFDPWSSKTIKTSCTNCGFTAFLPNSFTVSSENKLETFNSRVSRINYEVISKLTDNGLIEKKYQVNTIEPGEGTELILHSVKNATPTNLNSWKENQLFEQIFYKKNNLGGAYQKIKKQEFTYSLINETFFHNYNIESGIYPVSNMWDFVNNVVYNNVGGDCRTLFCQVNGKVGIHYYKNYVYNSKLTEQITTEYFDDGSKIVSTTNYEFDSPYHLQTTKTITSTSEDNKEIIIETDYPQDRPSGELYMDKLINAHRIANPIEVRKYIANDGIETLLTTKRTGYGRYDGPALDYLYLPKSIKTLKGGVEPLQDSELEKRITYHKYDANGNPTEISKTGGIHIAYVWGYNGQYPIAKIEYSTYASLPSNELAAIIAGSNDSNISEQQQLTRLEAFRDAIKNSQYPNRMVTTMTYKPMVGMTTITEPKGDVQTFEYDNLNRLKKIFDKQGHLLKEYDYKYHSQN